MKARDLMTREILTVYEDMPVTELAAFFAENQITGTAVIDEQRKLVGVVSLSDIATRAGESKTIVRNELDPNLDVRGWEEIYNREEVAGLHIEHADLLVRDVMSRAAWAVSENTEISRVAEKMLHGPLHRLFVTRGDELTGVISTFDFLRLFAGDTSVSAAG